MLEHQLSVGRTYRFTFKPEFERHGVCTTAGAVCLHKGAGVFTLKQISSFRDAVASGVDLYKSFFEPLGFTKEKYKEYFSGKPENDYEPKYETRRVGIPESVKDVAYLPENNTSVEITRTSIAIRDQIVETGESVLKKQYIEELSYSSFPVYKLVDVVDPDDVLFVPEKAIAGFPEVDIAEYQNMTLAIDLGYWDDPTKLDGVLNALRERMAAYGIQPLNINLFSADSLWMSPDEYNKIKKTRVPGDLVVIEEDQKSAYIGKTAIIDGMFKEIVEEVSDDPELAELQVGIDSLSKGKCVIDARTFLHELKPETDFIFELDKQYYVQSPEFKKGEDECYIKLEENKHYNPGDPIQHYCLTADTVRVEGKEYFVKGGPTYLPFSERDNLSTAIKFLEAGKKVYRRETPCKTVVVGDRVMEGEIYITFEADGITFHEVTDLEPNYEFTEEDAKRIYIKYSDEYSEVTKEIVEANQTERFYQLVSEVTYTEIVPTTSPKAANLYERAFYHVEDFSSDAATALISKRFSFINNYGALTKLELSIEDIIMVGCGQQRVILSNDIVYNKYIGRMFEYSVDLGEGLTSTVAVVLSDANKSKLLEKQGVITGQTGEMWKEVYIENNTGNRNYYKLWTEAIRTQQALIAKCAAQEALIKKLKENA